MQKTNRLAQMLAIGKAKPEEIDEIKEYSHNQFQFWNLDKKISLPPSNELHLSRWRKYCIEAERIGVAPALKKRLVQLCFPIDAGISQTSAYKEATKKGRLELPIAGVEFQGELELHIQATIAGEIPVIIAHQRSDFVSLVRALTMKNEPQAIADSMGACIVGGYNNWDRIRQYRQGWSERASPHNTEADWQMEFKRLIPQKQLYQDCSIILSSGSYSNVNPADLGLDRDIWQELSLKIRLEHECTHYLTRRLLGSMRNNLLDEAIADYRGIVAANGSYRADWFLHFLGLAGDEYRAKGRLENYRGSPSLSAGAFAILQTLVRQVAYNLEAFDRQYYSQREGTEREKLAVFLALTSSTIIDLAAADAVKMLIPRTVEISDRLPRRSRWRKGHPFVRMQS